MSDLEEPKPSGISRRTVAKAMAWSVPAVALAVPAPAYAASGGGPTIVPGVAWKLPGNSCSSKFTLSPLLDANKAYLFTFRVENNTSKPIYIYASPLPTVTTTSGLAFTVAGTEPALPALIAPGGFVDLGLYANGSDSGNLVFEATATIYWGHSLPTDPDNHPAVTLTWQVPGTPTPQSGGYVGAQACTPPFVPVSETPEEP